MLHTLSVDGTGKGFGSFSNGFKLANGATRAPDLSWIRNERWNALAEEEQNVFAPICPDFVVELRSPSGRLSTLHAKMREYIDNGAQFEVADRSVRKKGSYLPSGNGSRAPRSSASHFGRSVIAWFRLESPADLGLTFQAR